MTDTPAPQTAFKPSGRRERTLRYLRADGRRDAGSLNRRYRPRPGLAIAAGVTSARDLDPVDVRALDCVLALP